jgi:hypothetical protein
LNRAALGGYESCALTTWAICLKGCKNRDIEVKTEIILPLSKKDTRQFLLPDESRLVKGIEDIYG